MTSFNKIKQALSVKGAKFVNLANYKTSTGEVQDALINVGISYRGAQERDLQLLNDMPETTLAHLSVKAGVSIETMREAKISVMGSIQRSLDKEETNAIKGQKDAFEHINEGIMAHRETGEIFVKGQVVRKTIRKEGEPQPERKSKPLTIAKQAIHDVCCHKKIRRYKLDKIKEITSKGDTLIIEECSQ